MWLIALCCLFGYCCGWMDGQAWRRDKERGESWPVAK